MRVKPEKQPLRAREFLETLVASGRYHFTSAEAQAALALSRAAAAVALNRLSKRGAIASPARGFYVIVPPEYRSLGCLPAEQFIPALMKQLELHYYAGLLTAAQYHGAAHHRPQEFQVLIEGSRRPLSCGRIRVAFMARKRLSEVPVQDINTPRGPLRVSTPEATALDLVGYQHQAGGLNQVAALLAELAEKLDPAKLTAAAETAPLPWAQRLGFLLEQVDAAAQAAPLKDYVRARTRISTAAGESATRQGKARRRLEALHQYNSGARPVIPHDYITEWRREAPWVEDFQVEQDLVISRALVEIFANPVLRDALAFRGGTALYKLHLRPPARYSEDIDSVHCSRTDTRGSPHKKAPPSVTHSSRSCLAYHGRARHKIATDISRGYNRNGR
jgi:predicted transcriptional regulator of viral defense system